MSLRDQIVGACSVCKGKGYLDDRLCYCLLKFRAYNRLIGKGFKKHVLDFATSPDYRFPPIDDGEISLNYYLNNLSEVETKGLSLYIFSRDKGRGKTTLAHHLMYQVARRFSETPSYRRESSLSFGFDRSGVMTKEDGYKGTGHFKSTFYVLDDLGGEKRTPKWKKELVISSLQEILHHRRDLHLPTVITSNYHPSDLVTLYDGALDSLLEIKSGEGEGLGGSLIRQVEVGGDEDLRLVEENSAWPDGM